MANKPTYFSKSTMKSNQNSGWILSPRWFSADSTESDETLETSGVTSISERLTKPNHYFYVFSRFRFQLRERRQSCHWSSTTPMFSLISGKQSLPAHAHAGVRFPRVALLEVSHRIGLVNVETDPPLVWSFYTEQTEHNVLRQTHNAWPSSHRHGSRGSFCLRVWVYEF